MPGSFSHLPRATTAVLGALLVGTILSVAACREPGMAGVGYSHTDPSAGPSTSVSASGSGSTWALASTFAKWPKVNTQRFPSQGHWFGRYDADVHVETDDKAYVALAPGGRVPEGTRIVEVMTEHGSGLDGPIFVMEKAKEGWVYVEVDARRRELRRGRLEPCVTCHLQVADQDELFGLPAAAN